MPELKPCPACGEAKSIVFIQEEFNNEWRGHCRCGHVGRYCATREAAIAAWNSLPRALTWTTEPPKVAGWYWWRDVSHKGEATIQYMSQSQVERLKTYPGEEWAGPIPMPLEQEES